MPSLPFMAHTCAVRMGFPACVIVTRSASERFPARSDSTSSSTASKRATLRYWHA